MTRPRSTFRCGECGAPSPKWAGRCPTCGEWNSLAEELEGAPSVGSARSHGLGAPLERPVRIGEVSATEWAPQPTGLPELDRVLGGGLVPGSATLVGGEPGIGKSTLLLQLAAAKAAAGATVLYVSAEEARQQVRLRAERLGTLSDGLWLVSETSVPHIVAHVADLEPDVLVVDSIQTVHDPALGSAPGTVGQVRESAHALVQEAKARGMATFLVGHVTKDGALAGPRVLEHLVDTVLAFEGDRHHALRLLRAVKHRFGPTADLGLFEMSDAGLVAVPDASALFLSDRRPCTPGSVVVPTIEGHRPLLVELQALLAPSSLAMPRRSAQGVDSGRLAMLLAVLERRAHQPSAGLDVHVLAVGGVRVVEPGADLGLALAIASAAQDIPVAPDLVACGEVGLGGELRQVAQTERRLAEAARLGFRRALVPASAPEAPPGIDAVRAFTLAEAVALALSLPPLSGNGRPATDPPAASNGRPSASRGPVRGLRSGPLGVEVGTIPP
ncbi:MAG: DNA repair protein RadA [Actinobacteria bacterium]|nr:DNA repair protein RadA [Actinomycetota bacterium]